MVDVHALVDSPYRCSISSVSYIVNGQTLRLELEQKDVQTMIQATTDWKKHRSDNWRSDAPCDKLQRSVHPENIHLQSSYNLAKFWRINFELMFVLVIFPGVT